MEYIFFVVLLVIVMIAWTYSIKQNRTHAKREAFIEGYQFPQTLQAKVLERYPHLKKVDADHVIRGLRQYFQICSISGKRMVSMPSQVVDVAWHEFILFTRDYQRFCQTALGRFLHHTPAEAMSTPTHAQKGIKTAWQASCFRENIQPTNPERLPMLFAIDAKLKIPDGFAYSLNCLRSPDHKYCASHIGCGSGCGGDSGCTGGCGGD